MGEQGHETQREQEQILSQFPGFQPENEAEESFLARLLFVILLPPALFFKEIKNKFRITNQNSNHWGKQVLVLFWSTLL